MHECVVQTNAALSDASGTLVIQGNPRRKSICLASVNNQTTEIVFGGGNSPTNGVSLGLRASPTIFSEDWMGSAVQDSIVLSDTAGAQRTYTWIEVLYVGERKTCKGLPGYVEGK